MRFFLKLSLCLFLFVILVGPLLAFDIYYKSEKGELMVRVVARYDGPDFSPYLLRDSKGIARKEAAAARVLDAFAAVGGKIGYSFQHVNMVSGSIPVSQLSKFAGLPGVVEIVKDKPVYADAFDFMKATKEEKKAFVKQKAKELANRLKTEGKDQLRQRMLEGILKSKDAFADGGNKRSHVTPAVAS